jgi:enamine deaminase RidA (YjgF/YER057c/UK114 family)
MKHLIAIIFLTCGFSVSFAQSDIDKRLAELGIELQEPSAPVANYVKAVRTGNLVYLSGHGPLKADGNNIEGKVGKNLTTAEGAEAARVTAIGLLSSLKAELGDLSRVKRIVKVNGWVNCTDKFKEQPQVMNGCSDLLVAVFGDKGKHARTSLGTNSLPGNIAVEIEMVVEVE